eukprot:TRINITY_DN19549_c0_g3_i2.p1 TRINITY_DN19549_c0_g3~~TRINITY_DN19549_c0_g3_i2.p1  ORF type:complete len:365 (+),score=46.48 TRINITY_DN19549_c0_g3_i2:37-1131(+)
MHLLLATALAAVISPSDKNIQYIGRAVALPSGEKQFDNPGFTVKFKVQGATEVSVQMKARHALPSEADGSFILNFFETLVDGVRQPTRLSTAVTQNNSIYTFEIAKDLQEGAHDIVVFKSTEADWNAHIPTPNYMTFSGIVLSDGGSLVAPEPLPTRRMEFIGDSITAGYCNLCHEPSMPTNEYAQSFYDSWASQICRGVGAVCHAIAWSGFGVIRNYAPGNVTLPDVYLKTLASDVNSPDWDFSSWKPDAVVVNLGTNDNVVCVGDFCERFIAAYVSMVKHAAQIYGPTTSWFLACGPMSEAYCPQVYSIISDLTDQGIKAHFLDQTKLGGNDTCCGHPSVKGDGEIAESSMAFIQQTMGWSN